jgi:hypothetical protein
MRGGSKNGGHAYMRLRKATPREEELMALSIDDHNQPYLEAARCCYELIENLKVDNVDDVEGIERAIDLALERRHDPGPSGHLLGDVLRNGRFSARRSQKRRRRVERHYASEQPRIATGKRRIPGDRIAPDSPRAGAEAHELRRELDREARAAGRHGPVLLRALIEGETVSKAAAKAGVSRSTAHRTVKRLRQTADRHVQGVAA